MLDALMAGDLDLTRQETECFIFVHKLYTTRHISAIINYHVAVVIRHFFIFS